LTTFTSPPRNLLPLSHHISILSSRTHRRPHISACFSLVHKHRRSTRGDRRRPASMRRRSRSPSSTRWGSCAPSSTRHRGHAWGILRAVEHASREAACRRARVAGGRAPTSTRRWRPRADEHEASVAGSDEHAGELHAVEHASPETMRRGARAAENLSPAAARHRACVAAGRASRWWRPRAHIAWRPRAHRCEHALGDAAASELLRWPTLSFSISLACTSVYCRLVWLYCLNS
jgi:hypothetical protein